MTQALAIADTRETTRRNGRSFYWASWFLRGEALASAYALYAFFRRLDDWFDESASADEVIASEVIAALVVRREVPRSAEGPWSLGELTAVHEAVKRHDLPAAPFFAMLEGMQMDLHGYVYRTDAEVDRYCYCVAGSVGELMACVFGVRTKESLDAAIALGKAMQRTNILRDIGEDLARGRVYVAEETLHIYGFTTLAAAHAGTAPFFAMMRAEIARARALYAAAVPGYTAITRRSFRLCAMVMAELYSGILGRIEQQDYNVFTRRAIVPAWRKVAGIARAAARFLLGAPRALPRRRLEVAVIGGGIGGLTAAALLAHRGESVALFDQQATLGGKAQRLNTHGVTLDVGPTLLTMPSVARALFAELGATDLFPPLHTLEVQCEYRFTSGKRFRAYADLERMTTQAEAIAPGEGNGLRAFYAEAEAIYRAAGDPFLTARYRGLGDFLWRVVKRGGALTGLRMATLHALACRHFKSPEMRQFVGRFATYVGGSPFEMSAAFAMIAHLERTQGVHHVEGGMGALAEALARAAERVGVAMHTQVKASATRTRAGYTIGHSTYDAVVSNADPLSDSAATALSMSGHVLLLSVPRRLVLPHHTVIFSADYAREFATIARNEVPDDPTIYVCHPAATDPTMAEPTHSGLFVMINAAPCGERYPVAQSRARILAALARAGIDCADATVIAERTPADFMRLGAPQGSIYGALGSGRLGPFSRPKPRARDGRFFAGGGTHPGGGVPMVMLSGRYAAEAVEAATR